GRLLEKDAEAVILEVGGVGYQIAISGATSRTLGLAGTEARLWIYSHYVQDGGPSLFGFSERDERALFETLLGVQGVGPKVALAILSGLPATELTKAIAGADVARLTQIRGVGRKTAERLAVELRDKLVPFPVAPQPGSGAGAFAGSFGGSSVSSGLPERLADVQGALMTLGYRLVELEPVIARMDPSLPVPDLVKQGLAALRRI
ncbi:MAG: Holliday junction branch migration protein RuvA, partial [Deltaproteobacteria bacterium]|nr:Holliday junction branch migration protein RuvA [Deltaproteobacteria bacterium]